MVNLLSSQPVNPQAYLQICPQVYPHRSPLDLRRVNPLLHLQDNRQCLHQGNHLHGRRGSRPLYLLMNLPDSQLLVQLASHLANQVEPRLIIQVHLHQVNPRDDPLISQQECQQVRQLEILVVSRQLSQQAYPLGHPIVFLLGIPQPVPLQYPQGSLVVTPPECRLESLQLNLLVNHQVNRHVPRQENHL